MYSFSSVSLIPTLAPRNYEILRQISGLIKSVPRSFDFRKALVSAPPTAPTTSTTSSSSSEPQVAELSSPILSELAQSKLSQAYLSEYTEAAIIIALARMYPLLHEFQQKERAFGEVDRKCFRIRQTLREYDSHRAHADAQRESLFGFSDLASFGGFNLPFMQHLGRKHGPPRRGPHF